MAKSTHSVVATLPNRFQDHTDYWKRNLLVNGKGEHLHSGMLTIGVTVEARNKVEAEALVRKQHPNHTIDSDATAQLGW